MRFFPTTHYNNSHRYEDDYYSTSAHNYHYLISSGVSRFSAVPDTLTNTSTISHAFTPNAGTYYGVAILGQMFEFTEPITVKENQTVYVKYNIEFRHPSKAYGYAFHHPDQPHFNPRLNWVLNVPVEPVGHKASNGYVNPYCFTGNVLRSEGFYSRRNWTHDNKFSMATTTSATETPSFKYDGTYPFNPKIGKPYEVSEAVPTIDTVFENENYGGVVVICKKAGGYYITVVPRFSNIYEHGDNYILNAATGRAVSFSQNIKNNLLNDNKFAGVELEDGTLVYRKEYSTHTQKVKASRTDASYNTEGDYYYWENSKWNHADNERQAREKLKPLHEEAQPTPFTGLTVSFSGLEDSNEWYYGVVFSPLPIIPELDNGRAVVDSVPDFKGIPTKVELAALPAASYRGNVSVIAPSEEGFKKGPWPWKARNTPKIPATGDVVTPDAYGGEGATATQVPAADDSYILVPIGDPTSRTGTYSEVFMTAKLYAVKIDDTPATIVTTKPAAGQVCLPEYGGQLIFNKADAGKKLWAVVVVQYADDPRKYVAAEHRKPPTMWYDIYPYKQLTHNTKT